MTRRLATIIAVFGAFAPTMAYAQTNLDQGKSASQIFTAACAECHKGAPRALAHGKNASALTEFLFDHYTTNRQQAAALASYVLGGRGDEAASGTPARGQKPASERGKPADEAKSDAKSDSKPEGQSETKAEAKPKRRDARVSGKPEEGVANPKRQAPAAAEPKSEPNSEAKFEPKSDDGDKPISPPRRRNEPKPPQQAAEQPAGAVHAPAEAVPVEPAHDVVPPKTGEPGSNNAETAPAESAPVPRDNIAD